MIQLWTDGSGRNGQGNDPSFGFGFVVVGEDGKPIACGLGGFPKGTNNMGELLGILYGMNWLYQNGYAQERVTIVSDSQYALGCFDKWRWSWEDRGFSKDGHPIPNANLIKRGCAIIDEFRYYPKFMWIKGHNGTRFNELADKLAGIGRRGQIPPTVVRV